MRLIDADELKKYLNAGKWKDEEEKQSVLTIIDCMPTVDTERHGHWILYDDNYNAYECSVCGRIWCFIDETPKDNEAYYCQKCGAKMDEVIKNDN